MTTENSRADALTQDERDAFGRLVASASTFPDHNGRSGPVTRVGYTDLQTVVAFVKREILSPVEQPAAAPIDIEARFVAEHGHRLAQLFGIDSFDIADRDAQIMAVLKNEQPAPSPADERAALLWTAATLQEIVSGRWNGAKESDKVSIGSVTKTVAQVLDMADVALGRAASATETGAEGAKPIAWLIDWPEEPDLGHYFAEEPCDPVYGRSRALGFMASRSPAMAIGPVRAWETDDGRVISDEQKQGALRDGGASASSVRPYSIALGRIGAVPAMAAEAVAGLFVKRSKFGPWIEIEKPEPGAVTLYAAPQPAQADTRETETAGQQEGHEIAQSLVRKGTVAGGDFAREGLTDEQVKAVAEEHWSSCRYVDDECIYEFDHEDLMGFARAIFEGAKQ